MDEKIVNMIYCLHMNAKDKRRKEDVRKWLTEIEQCLKDCNNERKRYKEELDTIKQSLKTLTNLIKEEM